MAIAVVLMGYNGVQHVLNFNDLHLYQSVWTWLSAILVNSSGTVLALIGACGLFQVLLPKVERVHSYSFCNLSRFFYALVCKAKLYI